MALVTYPLNNVDYTAEDAELYNCTRTSGVFAGDDFSYSVTGNDNTITIGTGIAWIRNGQFSGKVVALKSAMDLDMGLSDSYLPRVDAIVIEFDANQNESNIVVKHGDAKTNPSPPELVQTESRYELHLYHIYREAGATSIVASDITDRRLNSKYCGLMADAVTDIEIESQKTAIGTIELTVRTDKDSSWLLCNGAVISEEDYPELYEMLKNLASTWGTEDLWESTGSVINSIAYGNGYWVAGGRYTINGEHFYARIAYTTSLSGAWTTQNLWGGASIDNCINSIAYENGYWVAGGQYADESTSRAAIAYVTSPSGTWTTQGLWESTGSVINSVVYGNGYWVAGGRYTINGEHFYARIAYTTSLSGAWTTQNLWGGASIDNCINSIAYENGYWVAGGQYADESVSRAAIAYVTSPSGTWTTQGLWESTGSVINSIAYGNGYWVAGGRRSNGDRYYATLAYTTDPSETWTTKNLWGGDGSGDGITSIAYGDGYWIVGSQYTEGSTCYGKIAYATSPNAAWYDVDLWESTDSAGVISVAYENNYWVFGGQYADESTSYGRVLYTIVNGRVFLPTISISGAYAYIKASL